jgi:hypothetical protein
LAFVNGCIDILDEVLVFLVQVFGGELAQLEERHDLKDFREHRKVFGVFGSGVSLSSEFVFFVHLTGINLLLSFQLGQFATRPHPIILVSIHRNMMKLFSKFIGQLHATRGLLNSLSVSLILNESQQ